MMVFASGVLLVVPQVRAAMRHIDVPVPLLLDKIDRPIAGAVSMAVFPPLFRMTGRHVQVDRLPHDVRGPNNNRPCIDNLRPGSVADINATVESGFAYAYRHADICGLCGDGGEEQNDDEREVFHFFSFLIFLLSYRCRGTYLIPPCGSPQLNTNVYLQSVIQNTDARESGRAGIPLLSSAGISSVHSGPKYTLNPR
jgi:hypothetical protein